MDSLVWARVRSIVNCQLCRVFGIDVTRRSCQRLGVEFIGVTVAGHFGCVGLFLGFAEAIRADIDSTIQGGGFGRYVPQYDHASIR